MRILVLALILPVLLYGGYWVGRRRNYGDDGQASALTTQRDAAHLVLKSTHNSLRAALADPTLSPTSVVMLDDARIEIERALPKELKP